MKILFFMVVLIIAVGYAFRIGTSAPSEVTEFSSPALQTKAPTALTAERKMSRMAKKTGMDSSALWAAFLILLSIAVYTYFRS
jgi:hypothetical protein